MEKLKRGACMMNNYVIAKYIRLSVDEKVSESLSIPNQRIITGRHIETLDIPDTEIIEFVDNGYSGTDMERPAVQELIELVRSGGVNCICVKDFSRFSRNAMDSGYFIEQVFPLYGVRFISVSDCFDSNDYKNDTGGIDVAFKFLMHEYYSKDLSVKVSSAKRIKMRAGESIPKNAIYGYYKAETGKWEPEEPAASVIREIFQMALSGFPASKIKDEMFKAGYPTPKEFINAKQGKDVSPACLWKTPSINKILRNEQYAGTYISGKLKSQDVGSRIRIPVDKSDWIIIPDHHTPIVEKTVFDDVQKILESYLLGKVVAVSPTTSWRDNVTTKRRRDMISGAFKIRKVKYGYRKLSDGTLEIDETAADVIRKVFKLARQGLSFDAIRDRLTADRHPIPSDHLDLQRGIDITPCYEWKTVAVRDILANLQYTGAYVSGKTLKDYETGKIVCVPKCDWIVIPDVRPRIISDELFNEVQEIIASNRYRPRNPNVRNHLLKSKVVCGSCGFAMNYDPQSEPLYRCYNTAANPAAKCHKLKVEAGKLDAAVLEIIQKQAELIFAVSELGELAPKGGNGYELSEHDKRIAGCIEKQQQFYESFIMREIERDEYIKLKNALSEEIEWLNKQAAAIKTDLRVREANLSTLALAKNTLDKTVTHKEIVDTLIEKVQVFSEQHIEIEWKIADFAKY